MPHPVVAWGIFLAITLVLVVFVFGAFLSTIEMPRPLLVVVASLVGLFWMSLLAAAVSSHRRPPRSAKGGLGAATLTIMALVGIVVSNLILVEVRQSQPSAAFTGPFWEPAPYVMFHPKPGLRIERPNDVLSHGRATGIITTNTLGFRGNNWPAAPKQRDEIRVAFLGGSVVFNGLTDDRTIPALFGRALESRLPGLKVTVMNGGLLSANSSQEVVLLQSQLVDFDPDIVVVLDGFNDVWLPLYYDDRIGYPFNFYALESAWRAYEEQQNVLDWIWAHSRTARFLLSPFHRGDDPGIRTALIDRGDTQELRSLPGLAATGLMKNWKKIQSICEANAIDCVFALQPTLLYRRAPNSAERAFLPSTLVERTVASFYQQAENAIAQLVSGGELRSAAVASLAGIFEDYGPDAYWDTVHPFDEGNVVIAARLIEELCRGAKLLPSRCSAN